MRKEFPLEDQSRIDKDDEMFGRGGQLIMETGGVMMKIEQSVRLKKEMNLREVVW